MFTKIMHKICIQRNAIKTLGQSQFKGYFSTNTRHIPPIVGKWLLGTAALTFGIVSLGGATRLTESGLSIVEWNLVTGVVPPLTEKSWKIEFEKYQQFPEYKM